MPKIIVIARTIGFQKYSVLLKYLTGWEVPKSANDDSFKGW